MANHNKAPAVIVEPKKPVNSRTLWLGFLSAIFFIVDIVTEVLSDEIIVGFIPDDWAKYVGLALAIASIVLRYKTTQPLTSNPQVPDLHEAE